MLSLTLIQGLNSQSTIFQSEPEYVGEISGYSKMISQGQELYTAPVITQTQEIVSSPKVQTKIISQPIVTKRIVSQPIIK